MIIDKITLHNFGVYKGRHEIVLTPQSRQKPITLFGGLNGGGKTTFLDALLLVLYGKFAKCSNRGNSSYDDYLKRCINRQVKPLDGAAIELEFRHRYSGVEETVRIYRGWRATGKGLREDIEVYRDGILDKLITERWYEFIEQLIPYRISHLFFFDGEKIENMASPDEAANLIRTGIYALLGLDLVDTLAADLCVIEKRQKMDLVTGKEHAALELLEQEINELEQRRAKNTYKLGELKIQLDDLNKKHRSFQSSYKDQGGELYEQREVILAHHERISRELVATEDRMRELAAGTAPLLLVKDLISSAHRQAESERSALANLHTLPLLAERDQQLLAYLEERGNPDLESVRNYLDRDRSSRSISSSTGTTIGITPEALEPLLGDHSDALRADINSVLDHASNLADQIADSDRRLAMIPDPAGLQGISAKMKENEQQRVITEHQIKELGLHEGELTSQIERKTVESQRLMEINVKAEFGNEKAKKLIEQSVAIRATIDKYKLRMTKRHLKRLEQLVLESYQTLLRKDSLITRVMIDPQTFEVHLLNASQLEIPLDRLSAGERQLLAVSILWGLGKASGRSLPTVIDTPLGRLDGMHRLNLVQSYFPAASHQVILLSTDQEVNESYYKELKPHIGHEYSIDFSDRSQSSEVTDGYFWKGAA